jgi:peptidoglycan hydrolase FlgJ
MKITSDVSSQVDPAFDSRRQAKLVDAAQQFEGMMLQEMLKPMRGGKDSWGGDEKSDEDSAADTISSFGTEALAKSISEKGGFGIAKQVIAQVGLGHQRNAEKKSHGTKVYGHHADTLK